MYHNAKFQDILNITKENSKFKIGNKQIHVINMTNYLKLESRNKYEPYSVEEF